MKIYIASDHAGEERKKEIIKYLNENNIEVLTIPLENNPTDDYPKFAFMLCSKVVKEKTLGLLICGNGIGMSIAANKVKGIRAARCCSVDDAFKAKNHNGANVITIGANLDLELSKEIIDSFLVTKDPNEERHLRRVNEIITYENGDINEL